MNVRMTIFAVGASAGLLSIAIPASAATMDEQTGQQNWHHSRMSQQQRWDRQQRMAAAEQQRAAQQQAAATGFDPTLGVLGGILGDDDEAASRAAYGYDRRAEGYGTHYRGYRQGGYAPGYDQDDDRDDDGPVGLGTGLF